MRCPGPQLSTQRVAGADVRSFARIRKQGAAHPTETWILLPCRLFNCLVPPSHNPSGNPAQPHWAAPPVMPRAPAQLAWPVGSSLGPGPSTPAPFWTWCGQVREKRPGEGGPRLGQKEPSAGAACGQAYAACREEDDSASDVFFHLKPIFPKHSQQSGPTVHFSSEGRTPRSHSLKQL